LQTALIAKHKIRKVQNETVNQNLWAVRSNEMHLRQLGNLLLSPPGANANKETKI